MRWNKFMNIQKKKWTSMHLHRWTSALVKHSLPPQARCVGNLQLLWEKYLQPIFYVKRMTISWLKVCSTKASEKTSDTSDECSSFRKYGGRWDCHHHITSAMPGSSSGVFKLLVFSDTFIFLMIQSKYWWTQGYIQRNTNKTTWQQENKTC